MYPWIRDAAAAAAAAVSFAGTHHHPHHHQINSSGMIQSPGGIPLNGNVKAENGFPSSHNNSGNDCMLAIDYAHNKVRFYDFYKQTSMLCNLLCLLALYLILVNLQLLIRCSSLSF